MEAHLRSEQQANTVTFSFVVRNFTVAIKDLQDVEHSVEVTAETLDEAVATAIAALQKDNWVEEIGEGFTTVTVLVQQPPIKHALKKNDFISWLGLSRAFSRTSDTEAKVGTNIDQK